MERKGTGGAEDQNGLLPIFGFLSRYSFLACVAIGFWLRSGVFGSQQSLLALCRNMAFFVSRQSWPRQGKVSSNRASLCRDIVGQGRENFCCDKGLLGCDRAVHDRKFCRPRQSQEYEGQRAWRPSPRPAHDLAEALSIATDLSSS